MYCGAVAAFAFLAPKVHRSCTHCAAARRHCLIAARGCVSMGARGVTYKKKLLMPRKFGELLKYFHLSNSLGGGAKVPELINGKEGINKEEQINEERRIFRKTWRE